MKRSEINAVYREALGAFATAGWALPPSPHWDITDFGLGDFNAYGLTLINLAEEPEYCEKLMYCRQNQVTPAHTHRIKKEDIICRNGKLAVQMWKNEPSEPVNPERFNVQVNGEIRSLINGEVLILNAGERVTLTPGIYHAFWGAEGACVVGEVSTANDDATDNIFVDPNIGRFPGIEEDAAAEVTLISEKQ